jgi:hypothetical protein
MSLTDDNRWDGVSIQNALVNCEIVAETRVTDAGPGHLYFLKLGPKLIPLGINEHFCKMLQFALERNARAFDAPRWPQDIVGPSDG